MGMSGEPPRQAGLNLSCHPFIPRKACDVPRRGPGGGRSLSVSLWATVAIREVPLPAPTINRFREFPADQRPLRHYSRLALQRLRSTPRSVLEMDLFRVATLTVGLGGCHLFRRRLTMSGKSEKRGRLGVRRDALPRTGEVEPNDEWLGRRVPLVPRDRATGAPYVFPGRPCRRWRKETERDVRPTSSQDWVLYSSPRVIKSGPGTCARGGDELHRVGPESPRVCFTKRKGTSLPWETRGNLETFIDVTSWRGNKIKCV